MTENFPSEE